MGIRNVPMYQLCDTDEAKFCIVDIERKHGRGYKAVRVRDAGHYTRGAGEISLIMTVEPGNPQIPDIMLGSVRNPRKWWTITDSTIDQTVFSDYINYVCSDIETNPLPMDLDSRKIFLWDNLAVHGTALVHSTLEMRPTRQTHRFVNMPRPPYKPEVSPIEFIFGEISSILSKKCVRSWGVNELRDEIHNACMTVGQDGKLQRLFRHCGY